VGEHITFMTTHFAWNDNKTAILNRVISAI